jgi:hypothetical protein
MQTRSMKAKERIASGTVLHKLPTELLGIIATQTDKKGLASMRATCRELRDGSASEFFRRYTSLYIHLGGNERFDVLHLKVAIKTPDVVMAQAMTQSLILPIARNYLSVSPRNRMPLRKHVPHSVAEIVPDTPLDDFEIVQRSIVAPYKGSGVAQLLLKRIIALPPRTLPIRRLVLEDLAVDGDYVINLFETHGRHLQDVDLRNVVLTKAVECMVALSRTEVQKTWLDNLRVRDDAGNLQDLTTQSPALLELLRRLFQRYPQAHCIRFKYNLPPSHHLIFRSSVEI